MTKTLLLIAFTGLSGLLMAQSDMATLLPGDPGCNGVVQSDPQWGTVQVGTQMSCTIQVSTPGIYNISVLTKEPLSTISPGQRVFSVTINGTVFPNIDIVKFSPLNRLYEINMMIVVEKQITISFTAGVRTALWTSIVIRPKY